MQDRRIARLIAERRAVLAGCVGVRVLRAARRLRRRYDLALAPAGVTLSQLMLLLACVGDHPVAVAQVAETLGVDRTTLTRTFAPLAKRGWVALTTAADRRTRLVSLTAAGEERLNAALALWAEAEARVTDGASPAALAHLLAELDRLAGGERA